METLRVGVLGCGIISQAAHLESAVKARNTILYAICDQAEDLVEKMKHIHEPIVTYTNYDEMLADQNIDAIIIGIADEFHVPAAMGALDAGKHVLVEKPLGVNLKECLSLKEKVEETGLVLQVGNMKRFDEGITRAATFVREEMGEILALKAWYCDNNYRYMLTDNVMPRIFTSDRVKRPSINPKSNRQAYYILAHGSHLVDTAQFVGGNIVSIQAQHVEKFQAHHWSISAQFEDDFYAQLDLTIGLTMDWQEGFTVYGEHGSVVANTYNPWLFKSSDVEIFSTKDVVYTRPLAPDGHFYRRQLESFADAILYGTPMHGATVDDGINNMKAMIAIAESVRTGERVFLEDVSGGLV